LKQLHMLSQRRLLLSLTVSCATTLALAEPLVYDRDIRPILSEKCFLCHGQDSKKRMAGLRLDSFEGATADRGGHAALVPGKPESSAIYRRITSQQPARRMPPVSSNRTLTPEQIATLKRWIEEGGMYTKHWAFIPPKRPDIPKVADSSWVKQPIDAFVYQRLTSEHLRPSRPASPETWLRRVSLDLIGLPLMATPPMKPPSIACSPHHATASAWPSIGSTWPATPTLMDSITILPARCGAGATG
jgi:hypothetical protein